MEYEIALSVGWDYTVSWQAVWCFIRVCNNEWEECLGNIWSKEGWHVDNYVDRKKKMSDTGIRSLIWLMFGVVIMYVKC